MLEDAPRPSPSLLMGRQSEKLVVVENTPDVHNVVVCTLCSAIRGRARPATRRYKSAPNRARAVIDRAALNEWGRGERESRWDSTAEIVTWCCPSPEGHGKPERGRAGRADHRDRDDRRGRGEAVNGAHDLGGMHGFVHISANAVFHSSGSEGIALTLAAGFLGKWNIDMSATPASRCRRPSTGTSTTSTGRSGSRSCCMTTGS